MRKSGYTQPMTILLFPGRHLANTTFQADYLRRVVQTPLQKLAFWEEKRPSLPAAPINQIIFAITSSNQQHSRYNPIPFHVRAIGVDRFARSLPAAPGGYRIIGVPHFHPTPRFAEFVLKEIGEQSEGRLALTPQNCVVLCSTPAVAAQYRALGFAILPAEAAESTPPPTPIDLIRRLAESGAAWPTDPLLQAHLAPATFELWQDFPDVPRRVVRLWRDPLLTDAGSLTAERNYDAYANLMSNREIIRLKYDDIKTAVVPGKIVDEGCADGALLELIARDFPDSDLIGIEITGEFIARCLERQRAGAFGGAFVHFHQRNLAQRIFAAGTIDTTICNATTHELWSYGDGAATVRAYLAHKYAQTRRNGRLLIRDVVGPENGAQEVLLWLNRSDGENEDVYRTFTDRQAQAAYLEALSTYGRFRRFARDFLRQMRQKGRRGPETAVTFREESINGALYVVLPLRAAVEFMSKKDYTANWDSEMNEEFAFWSFSDWKQALADAGFTVLENPNHPQQGSRAYTNPWIVARRWEGKVRLFRRGAGAPIALPYPPTNVVLVAEKAPL